MTRIGDFAFPDFSFQHAHPPPSFENGNGHGHGLHSRAPALTPINTVFSPSADSPPTSALLSATPDSASHKRKATRTGSPESYEDASRFAAEEDKRRRNTAASARFRVKKKQREQALERSAKEMSDKVAALEGRINQLETENKWLKNLITEKNETKEDITSLWKKYSHEEAERKGSERKDGVGTKA
jgi:Basic region leucine zipper